MKKIIGIVVAVNCRSPRLVSRAGWCLGRDPMSFAGGSTVALDDYKGGDVTGVPPSLPAPI